METINKIIGKIIRGLLFIWEFVVLRSIYEISYRLNFPKLSALILVLLTKRSNGKKKYRVLCLGRSQFKDDIQALIDFSNRIQYLYFHKLMLGRIVRYMIPFSLDPSLIPGYLEDDRRDNMGTEDGFTYHVDPKYDSGKEKVYQYMSKMFPVLHKFFKFDAVMSGNYVYVDQQEFFKVCEDNNIPVIILNKEGIGARGFPKDGLLSIRGCKFIGSKMLMINEAYKRHDIKHLKDFNEEKACIIGIPRFDYYFNRTKKGLKQIVLFSFEVSDYIRPDKTQNILEKLEEITEKFHRNIMEFARKYPDYKVIIKIKGKQEKSLKYCRDIYNKYYNKERIRNLKITNNADVKKLILESQVILGFNSTVLIEAIAAEKMIISPNFNTVLEDHITYDFFSKYPDLVNYATEYGEIEQNILNYKNYTYPRFERRKQFLEPLISKADGKASQRAEQEIMNTIDNYKKKHNMA